MRRSYVWGFCHADKQNLYIMNLDISSVARFRSLVTIDRISLCPGTFAQASVANEFPKPSLRSLPIVEAGPLRCAYLAAGERRYFESRLEPERRGLVRLLYNRFTLLARRIGILGIRIVRHLAYGPSS
jgi:hypothetical protein